MVRKYDGPLFCALTDGVIRKNQKLLSVVRRQQSCGAGMRACPGRGLAFLGPPDVNHALLRFLCNGIHTLHDLPVAVRSQLRNDDLRLRLRFLFLFFLLDRLRLLLFILGKRHLLGLLVKCLLSPGPKRVKAAAGCCPDDQTVHRHFGKLQRNLPSGDRLWLDCFL